MSVPDLLRDEDAPVNTFRSKVESVCAPWIEDRIGLSPDVEQRALQTETYRLALFLGGADVDFAAIEAPPLYASEYSAFRKDVRRLHTAVASPPVVKTWPETKDLRRAQDELRIAGRASKSAARRAITMQAQACASAFGLMFELVRLTRIGYQRLLARSRSTPGEG